MTTAYIFKIDLAIVQKTYFFKDNLYFNVAGFYK